MPALSIEPIAHTDHDHLEDAYLQYVALIGSTVGAFVARYGGHYDTLRTDADTCFLLCANKYDPADDDFPKQLKRWVWFGLFDDYRTRTGIRRKTSTGTWGEQAVLEQPCYDEDPLDGHPLDDLSPDAALCVQLALDTPWDLAAAAAERGGRPQNLRSCMREHLRDVEGWTNRRVSEAFAEIQVAL